VDGSVRLDTRFRLAFVDSLRSFSERPLIELIANVRSAGLFARK
jgi:hypothetical protein